MPTPESTPAPKPKMDLYKQLEPFVRPYIWRNFNVNIEGLDNIPDEPAFYISNHVMAQDSLIFASAFTRHTKRPIRFGAKMDYFDGRGTDGLGKHSWLTKWAMEHTGQLPVDRDGLDPRSFIRLQAGMQAAVERGDSVGLYPEGTRNKEFLHDHKVHKFQAGAGRIALSLGIPIVPYAHVYSAHSNQRRIDADVIIGEPIMPDVYTTDPIKHLPTKLKAEYLMQMVENRVADLGQLHQSGVFAIRQTVHLPGKK
ncbi:MAG: lysophospholipid acyltransferase family protein [Candidatus Saccharimonadota bacterium]